MREVIHLKTEQDVNDLFKSKSSKSFKVLYTSLWDKSCNIIQGMIEENWLIDDGSDEEDFIYIIDSFNTPAAFASYSINVAPSLMHVTKGKIAVDVEYPKIYAYFEKISSNS
jgi:hypothetical protein